MTDALPAESVQVMQRGRMTGVDDTGWTALDILWAGGSGIVTNVRPTAPDSLVCVGVFLGSGVVEVDVREVPSYGELSGVLVEEHNDLDVMIFNASAGYWEPRQIDHGADLAGLTDDDHKQYSGRVWSWMMGD